MLTFTTRAGRVLDVARHELGRQDERRHRMDREVKIKDPPYRPREGDRIPDGVDQCAKGSVGAATKSANDRQRRGGQTPRSPSR